MRHPLAEPRSPRRSVPALAIVSGLVALAAATTAACGDGAPPAKSPAVAKPVDHARPDERHLAEVTQLTFGGENAEAYWSFGGHELSLQARGEGMDCDRIYRMPLEGILPGQPGHGTRPPLVPVSSGAGATTCSYFLPGDQEMLYASTHLGGQACPPKPDHSKGYVWPLYPTYDIFRAARDGSNVRRLTETPGYDAEATVCGKDGSVVFTSVRDGDLDLYRMDADGKNVRRLTDTPGYDGGAFFSADCSKIVWRASRPAPGKELDDYKALLAENLVRPSKLELWVANADGSDARQITWLNAASFAPYFHPSGSRILFSSNVGDPKGREFDIWAVDVDGSNLERVTTAGGFDGFPMFSRDGQYLAFSSNRATPEGKHDTNVFVARWVDGGKAGAPDPKSAANESGADRVIRDVRWLADPAREGRGVGTQGLDAAGAWLEQRFAALGLVPDGARTREDEKPGFRLPFDVVTRRQRADGAALSLAGKAVDGGDWVALGFSPEKVDLRAPLAFAGYGVVDKALGLDDYAKVDVKKKIAVVRRFVADGPKTSAPEVARRLGDLRKKAWLARERGAVGLVVVDVPAPPEGAPRDWQAPAESPLPGLEPEGSGDAGLPVVVVKRAPGTALLAALEGGRTAPGALRFELQSTASKAFDVVGRIVAEPAQGTTKLPGVVVVGAHYDHLGLGGRHSLAPQAKEAHPGADDNASGVAALLEIARELSLHRGTLRRDVVVVAFSGEESGLFGSAAFVRTWTGDGPPKKDGTLPGVVAMLNLDMVGRMRGRGVQLLGAETAPEWKELLATACAGARLDCAPNGDGYGPSDQMSFYLAGVPVLHAFTGTHGDYHKPSDTPDKLDAAGNAQVARLFADLARAVSVRDAKLTLTKGAGGGPQSRGDLRSFGASLGTVPDYGGPPNGKKGVLLAGVRPGGGADQGGMKKGDLLVKLGDSVIGSVEDLMYVLGARKPGETVRAIVERDGKPVTLDVTFQESARPR